MTNIIGKADYSFVDKSGTTNPEGLHVLRLVRKTPPTYEVKCAGCGCVQRVPHSRVDFARCQSSACGLPVRKRTPDEEARERRVARERAALEEEGRLSELRMQRETAEYQMPTKRPPVLGNDGPMTERQRLERRAWAEELEAEERERMRPIREAETQLQETHRQIRAEQRKRLTDPAIEDVDVYIAPEVAGASMPKSHADEHNIIEFQKFHKQHPDFYPTTRNVGLLHDYHVRNHAEIYTADMLGSVFQRMKEAGIDFDEPPAPEPKPMDYASRKPVELRIAPPAKPQPIVYEGFDLETGEPRTYTEREINRMSSDQMKRALRLTAASGALDLPNVGPGPRTRAQRGEL